MSTTEYHTNITEAGINSPASFDPLAETYDAEFSQSEIGSRMRKIVWEMCGKYIGPAPLNMLEINCGTGEDALYFASAGHTVTATDASAAMIEVANKKNQAGNPVFKVVPYQSLQKEYTAASFDIVFSNFGGLNCADELTLKNTLTGIHGLLKPGGLFIGVIMGTACIWERIYYLWKRDAKTAFRRQKKSGAVTRFSDTTFNTYYYSPKDIRKHTTGLFKSIDVKPVGLFVPPTYVEHYFKKHVGSLERLLKLEKSFNKYSALSNFADHYLIVLKK